MMYFMGRRFATFYGGSRFEQTYRCYPASSANNPHLEDGDKVILPGSALHLLTVLGVDYPMQFELRSTADAAAAADQPQRTSHCGVLEFVAAEGAVIMPRWMMRNMQLQEGDAVRVRSAALPKGTYVKLQPHTAAFLDVSNPKAVLEKTLRTFSCLTTGDTIMVSYNGRSYYIDVVETKPAAAVSIVDTDCEVDFATPLDYKEPAEKPQQPAAAAAAVPASNKAAADDNGDVVKKDEPPEFKPFTGSAKRLDGKEASKPQASEAAASTSAQRSGSKDLLNGRSASKQQQRTAPAAASSGASSSSRQKPGKLVFGSGATRKVIGNGKEPQKATVKQAEEPPKKDETPKFQAFTGKGYSLKRYSC